MKLEQLIEIKNKLSSECRILPEGDYLESAVMMPLIKIKDELHFLFEKRAQNIRQGGEVSFPGGQIDAKDKSPLDTAIRETVEELGIDEDSFEIKFKLGILINPLGVIVHTYVGKMNFSDLSQINFDDKEVEKVFTIPVSFFEENPPVEYKLRAEIKPYTYNKKGEKIELFPAEKLNLPKRYHNKWTIRDHTVLVYPARGEVVWGLTAKLINEFVGKLR